MTAPDWPALPTDLVNRVADCLLFTNDVDYYMDIRAVCHNWRAATTDPKSSPCDPRFGPSRWVLLHEHMPFNDDDDYETEPYNDDESRAISIDCTITKPFNDHETSLFVNTTTGRFVRKSLPLLRNYHLVNTITGGFPKRPPAVRENVRRPHTARAIDLWAADAGKQLAPDCRPSNRLESDRSSEP